MKDNNLLDLVINTIENNKLIEKGDKILVGVSGGSDSMCLIDILKKVEKKYFISLFVVHINHMLRGKEADKDEEFVKEYCEKKNIDFHSERVDVKKYSKDNKMSIEEAARVVRYKIFNEILINNKFSKIAVAHNKNDQAETVLMRILRGTGLNGITGMDYISNNIVRPLLDVEKDDIENYCKFNNINTILDKSNLQDIYTRNKIRLKLIPYLENEFYVDIIDRIHNMAVLLREDKEIVENLIEKLYNDVLINKSKSKIILDLEVLNTFSDDEIKRLLRYTLIQLKCNVIGFEIRHYNNLLSFVREKKTGKFLNMPKNIIASISYNNFILEFNETLKSKEFLKELNIPGVTNVDEINSSIKIEFIDKDQYDFDSEKKQNEFTQYFDLDLFIKKKRYIRNRNNGDWIIPYGFRGKKKIKDFFIDSKVPKYIRNEIPLIASDSEIIWIIGYRINNKYKVTKKTNQILKVRFMEGKNG
jgi:tRNA(Ile)-lysidine synthase